MKNWLERTPRTMGDWLALAAGTALLLAAAGQLQGLLRAAAGLLALLAPFGWGLVLAYVLDIPTRFFAAKLFGGRRGGALAVSYALLFGVLALLAGDLAYFGAVAPLTLAVEKRVKWTLSRPFALALWLIWPLAAALWRAREKARSRRLEKRLQKEKKRLQKNSKMLYNSN